MHGGGTSGIYARALENGAVRCKSRGKQAGQPSMDKSGQSAGNLRDWHGPPKCDHHSKDGQSSDKHGGVVCAPVSWTVAASLLSSPCWPGSDQGATTQLGAELPPALAPGFSAVPCPPKLNPCRASCRLPLSASSDESQGPRGRGGRFDPQPFIISLVSLRSLVLHHQGSHAMRPKLGPFPRVRVPTSMRSPDSPVA